VFAPAEQPRGAVARSVAGSYMLGVLAFVPPCSPSAARTVPAGDAWLHEPKLDGYRLQIAKEGRTVRLYSKAGHDWTKRLAGLAEALKGIACRSAVIDAEMCFLTGIGAPDFAGLQLALASRQHHKLTVYAFDLLHRDGKDMRPRPLSERRRRLELLLARSNVPRLLLVEAFADGEKLLEEGDRLGLEGLVSKRKASPYRSGPSRDWRKIKTRAWREVNRERWRLFERG
jgi:bifunctional non-homologous end joining protein LigD